jgi:hypothetical protein
MRRISSHDAWLASSRQEVAGPEIEDRHAGKREICDVSGDHSEPADGCRGGDEQIRLEEGVAYPLRTKLKQTAPRNRGE